MKPKRKLPQPQEEGQERETGDSNHLRSTNASANRTPARHTVMVLSYPERLSTCPQNQQRPSLLAQGVFS